MLRKRLVNIRYIDFLVLTMNMFVSHAIFGTPLLGASMFLFSNIFFLLKDEKVRHIVDYKKNVLVAIIVLLSFVSASVFFVFYPSIAGYNWYCSLIFILANFIVLMMKDRIEGKGLEEESVGADEIMTPFSFKIFHNMLFFSRMSLMTGLLMIITYISVTELDFTAYYYLFAVIWIFTLGFLYAAFNYFVRPNVNFSIFIFVLGAVLWIFATLLFYRSSGIINLLSLLVFSVSLSLITSSFSRFNKDFGLVLQLAGEKDSDIVLKKYDRINIKVSSLLSNCVVLIIITVSFFVMPDIDNLKIANIFSGTMLQFPILFMMIGVFYALNQPLDSRTRDKLVHYFTVTEDKDMNGSLYRILIKKYRVRYGVKIIATFLRPWLHLKVEGAENIKSEHFPSVFVCNHGIIYGPIAAVIYLPTYFRPWIDKKMLDVDLASEEMYSRHLCRIPLLGEKAKRCFARFLARPVVWAMNSFNPIGVERDNIRNVMTTFNDTIKALKESDNILLFPERPVKKVISGKETKVHSTDSVGDLFKGFAKLGNMYWKETGKRLAFYPIYADKVRHTFTIGEAVIYEPNNNVNGERDRIAEELKIRMDLLTSASYTD